MKSIPLGFLLLIIFGTFTYAGEPLVWTYSESWWENATPDPANNCVSQEPISPQDLSLICANARFRLTVRQTVELNPAANAHGVQQIVQIKDQSNNQIVSQEIKSDFYTGTQTIFSAQTSHEIDANPEGTGMGPFEGLVQHFPSCPDTGHPGGGGTLGSHGTAFLYYRFDSIHIPGNPGRAWYTHRPHLEGWCPSICPSPVTARIYYVGTPGPFAVIMVPIAYWRCSWVGGGAARNSEGQCWDFIVIV